MFSRMFFSIRGSLLVIAAALFFASPIVSAQSGFYLGGSFGQSSIKSADELVDLCSEYGIDCDNNSTSTQLKGIVGYQFGSYFGVELTGYDLGSPSVFTESPLRIDAKLKVKGGSLSLLPQFPIGDAGYIFGRLGATAGDATLTAEAPNLGLTDSESSGVAGLVYGIGGGINIGENVALRLEWERYSYDEILKLAGKKYDAPQLEVFSASFIYRFNR